MNQQSQQGCRAGFVPAGGSWNLNMDGTCRQRNRISACGAAPACRRAAGETVCSACVMKTAEFACSEAGRAVGMVRGTMQPLCNIYDSGRALKAGTLFPDLHKPMNGFWPRGAEAGTQCQASAFAAWEMRLYLDTHPEDAQALALMNQLAQECCQPNYATTFLPGDDDRWTWVQDPWPWEYDAQCTG